MEFGLSPISGWLDGGFRHQRSQESKGGSSFSPASHSPEGLLEGRTSKKGGSDLPAKQKLSLASVLARGGGLPSLAEGHPSLSRPSRGAYNYLLPDCPFLLTAPKMQTRMVLEDPSLSYNRK